ncbi:hypothetical protein B0T18DRAFT_415589 [Schizothecium vesticola]|uniref:DUF7580 domain-containing protein n=1 Tax=Schizothecium vesticola TaxID=314040 RepID=A0AA40K2T8_9PEZI|nr:hypothetical protein B0T18DRAFT_415589 [Schizothecium vesticola]
MSGFEIAGVVLGGVPVIVSALKLYIDGANTFQRWRFYTRELKSLIRSLETEQTKLQNVCERLLVNIVPETKIEDMINDPFGPLWKEEASAKKINERLWRSAKVFQDNVLDMNDAVEEMKKKLNLDADGKPTWIDSPGVNKEFRRVLFVLRRSDYQELIGRLRTGVSSLESLVTSNVQLEPDRHRRSRGRVCKVVRGAAMSVYHAVRGTVTCACPSPHDVGLRLTPQSVPITPDDDDEDVITSLKFHIAISVASTFMETEGQQWGTVRLWNQVSLRPLRAEKRISVSQPTTGPSHSVPHPQSFQRPKDRSRVSFASSTAASTASTTTESTTVTSKITTTAPSVSRLDTIEMQWTPTVSASSRLPTSISNLCQALKRSQKQGAGECCGHVTDKMSSRKFDVFPLFNIDDEDSGIWSMVSLGTILDGASDGSQHNTLTYLDRLRLAWTVASSVVQLQSTPWLASLPTHNDIFLIQQRNSTLRKEAFVLKQFSNTAGPIACVANPATGAARNPVLVALGVLLIELILGQSIQRLCPGFVVTSPWPSRYDLSGLDDDRNLMPILDKVNTLGGSNYHSAVRRCIGHDFGFGDLRRGGEDEMTQQNAAFFDVIGFLERDMEMVATI